MIRSGKCLAAVLLFLFWLASGALAQQRNDIPPKFIPPDTGFNYTKQEVMIPMRDGVKLFTVIYIPKGAHDLPVLLERTPYNAAGQHQRISPRLLDTLPEREDVFVEAGYIFAFQDVRGKYGSEGVYVMNPPPRGPLNPSGPNDTTDAYDTISWLVKNVSGSNGRVGMIGSSYVGFTVAMALLDPNPALKVAAPESPMVDGWMGDDWFHYGAFRQENFDYFPGQTAERGGGPGIPRENYDNYTNYLAHGSAGDFARYAGLEQLPFWRLIVENSAYGSFWSEQALDKVIAQKPLKVPTLWVQGLWDQEDMYGANHCYEAVEPKDKANDKNFLVFGPWWHGQENGKAYSIGPLRWSGDTAIQFRRDVLLPFFNQYLKDGAAKAKISPVTAFNTGENRWDHLDRWPLSCDSGCPERSQPIYFQSGGRLSFSSPGASPEPSTSGEYDSYISDPGKPVPYLPRPASVDGRRWRTWLVTDQRFADGRPDVLTYETEPLTEPLRLAGTPVVHLYASTSGTDSDWVVKLIDVYPGTVARQPEMGGYELPIALDIFRGRYRRSFVHPEPIQPGKPLLYRFALPNVNHVFLPGHRIMVQVQSTLFPLYDRNPQKFVENIFNARAGDYQKAEQRVWHAPGEASFIDLPVVR